MNFDDFVDGLRITSPEGGDMQAERRRAVFAVRLLRKAKPLDRAKLAELIRQHSWIVPYLASCAGLGTEQLRGMLHRKLNTSGWLKAGRARSEELVSALDEELGIVGEVNEQISRRWTLADVFMERVRFGSRRASESQRGGRGLEDQVDTILRELNIPHAMRTRFSGRNNQDAPCDFACPEGGSGALIVGAIKGFDSTGSKLSDAVREIQEMAAKRLPRQYVYAIVDGNGWRRRQADLRRIFALYQDSDLDGLYNMARLNEFRVDVRVAADRLSL